MINKQQSNKQIKITTTFDDEVLKNLKERASREGKTIDDVIREAVNSYIRSGPVNSKLRVEAARRLCTRPFNISLDQLNRDIAEDYYDQKKGCLG